MKKKKNVPMKNQQKPELEKEIKQLLTFCRLAALATCDGKYPHASLVAFLYRPENNSIALATPSSGKKYENLKKLQEAALLISEASGTDNDFFGSKALTVTGECKEMADKAEVMYSYIEKFPELADFARDSKTSFFRLEIRALRLVRNFQETSEIKIRD